MYASFYAGMRCAELPLFALLLFLCLFVVVVVRLTLIKRREDFEPVAHLPLQDDAGPSQTPRRDQP
jgi:hypothetical protein